MIDDTPAALVDWLRNEGWWPKGPAGTSLYDLPLPVHNWEEFDRLFEWNRRSYGDMATIGATYLGAAVRSFFAQGGRKCFIISLGEPAALQADRVTEDPQRSTSQTR